MRLTWRNLISWSDFIEAATTINDRHGLPSSSVLPTPLAVACLSPTPSCVDMCIASRMASGWCCTVPLFVPVEYDEAGECLARCGQRFAHKAQTPENLSSPHVESGSQVVVKMWLRDVLTAIAVSDHASAAMARVFLDDTDTSTTIEELELLGREMERRFHETKPWTLKRYALDMRTGVR